MNPSPSSSAAENNPPGFSILGILIKLFVLLCLGSALLFVAGFLGLVFLIMLYLGFEIALLVAKSVVFIVTGGA